VSKTPAKKTPSKPAAKKAVAKPAAKPVAKPVKKVAAKPAAKASLKPAKPAPKPVAKTAAKAPAKPAPKTATAAKTAAKTTPPKAAPTRAAAPPEKTAPKKTAAPHPSPVLVPTPKAVAPSPAPAPETVAPPPPVKASRSSKSAPVPQPPTPIPAATSRFADRFAPIRPPTRANAIVVETIRPEVKFDPKLVNAWKAKAGRDLTEPELLAMPDTEYMNEKQLEFFKTKLQALKDDLLSNAGETTEHLREDTSIVPDPADRATIEEEHALELRTRDRERKLLKKISQSLGRIESGEYGFCDETGEPIGLGRLIARPTATLSLEAQQRRELKQKMFGD
jgi:DnaK suppressor protein